MFVTNSRFSQIDWLLVGSTLLLMAAGLVTMNSFTAENYFFSRQIIWVAVSLAAFFGLSFFDFRFLRRSEVLIALFLVTAALLAGLLFFGESIKGARGWIDFGPISFQPADFAKVVVVLLLAKYFSRRHIEIARFRHIFISGLYTLVPFSLILLQPDFGSAVIIFLIWFGLIMVSGVSKRHLMLVLFLGLAAAVFLWLAIFTPNQKDRIVSFLHPLEDIQGAGYNAFQSTIAVGSGQLFGKGLGYGTQSRLEFLPEYETDFIFASFAEEWGLVGVFLLFVLFGIVIWRVLRASLLGATNFESLFALGLAIIFVTHFVIHVGMNIGLLPVTGLTLPFVSYGGSHLLASFIGLGILTGMNRYSRISHREDLEHEFLGGV